MFLLGVIIKGEEQEWGRRRVGFSLAQGSAAVELPCVGSPSFATLLLFEEVTDVLRGHDLVQATDNRGKKIKSSLRSETLTFGLFMMQTIRNMSKCSACEIWVIYINFISIN